MQRTKEAGAALPYLDYPDILEGSGFVLEGLEEKGLDAKTYIQVDEAQEYWEDGFVDTFLFQTMLRRTEGSSKEEQIYQKEQILAELQVRPVVMLSVYIIIIAEVSIPQSQTLHRRTQ